MLIVVKNRNVADFLELFLNIETFRALDVLKVDPTEGRLEQLDCTDQLIGVLGIQFNVKHVNIGKAFEEDPFTFHNRFAGECADIAKAENCSAVGNNSDQIALGGIFIGVIRVFFDFQARFGNPRAVGQRQVTTGCAWFCSNNFDLAFATH